MLPVLRSVLPPPNGSADAIRRVPGPDRLQDPQLRLRVGKPLDVLPGPIGPEVLDRSGLDRLLYLVGIPESARFAATGRHRDGNLGEKRERIDSRPDGMLRPKSRQKRRVSLRSPADRVLNPTQARDIAIRNSQPLVNFGSLPIVCWSFEPLQPAMECRQDAVPKSLHAQCPGLWPSRAACHRSLVRT